MVRRGGGRTEEYCSLAYPEETEDKPVTEKDYYKANGPLSKRSRKKCATKRILKKKCTKEKLLKRKKEEGRLKNVVRQKLSHTLV